MFLTDDEIREMCAPLKASAAQIRYLRTLGLVVNTKPNGRPLVVRSHAEAILSGRPVASAPVAPAPMTGDRDALIALFGRGKRQPR